MVCAFVFEGNIDIHAAPQDYLVEEVICKLKDQGVRFTKSCGETCEIFEQAFDECMSRECIINSLGLCGNEVIFVVYEPIYNTDIVYLDNETLACDLRRYLSNDNEYVDQATDETSRLNVNDGDNNLPTQAADEAPREEPTGPPRDEQPEEPIIPPRDEQPEEPINPPRDEQPEEPPKDGELNNVASEEPSTDEGFAIPKNSISRTKDE
uniref:Uncharacterized protein n=1 Tax=Parastrongyloides trichosuri TaxID=131310 RepID=A0A0N4ZPV3_PARTI